MKTTEIFIEQVLIGLLVLAIGVLPYINRCWLNTILDSIDKSTGIVALGSAGIVALAYLLGIVFDRFADTLLSRVEQYYRLKFAIKCKSPEDQRSKSDPYPEESLRAKIWGNSGRTADWIDYLRSRIRLSRSLAVFIPALTLSSLLLAGRSLVSRYVLLIILGVISLVYALSFIWVAFMVYDPNQSSKCKKLKFPKLPKTYDRNFESKMGDYFRWKREPTTIAAGLLALTAVILVTYFAQKDSSNLFKTVPILLIGGGISALSAWSWWRITKTFMQFLIDCKRAEVVRMT